MGSEPVPVSPPLPLAYAPLARRDARWGKGFLAICGTWVLCGLGHVIAGSTRRGFLWLLAWLVVSAACMGALLVPALSPLLLALLPTQVVIILAALIDAFVVGRRSPRQMLGRPALRYLAGIGLVIGGLIAWSGLNLATARALHAGGTETFAIRSSSMVPTLQPRDRILTHRVSSVRRWDLVVYRSPATPRDVFIGRIAGLPGETVEIVSGQLHANGALVPSAAGLGAYIGDVPSSAGQAGCEGHPIRLGPDEYYLLGDNSPIAYDSRWWKDTAPGHQAGAVPRDWIRARVTAIYFPLDRMRMFR